MQNVTTLSWVSVTGLRPILKQEAEAEGLPSQDYPELCSELCLGLGYALELNLGLGCTLVLYQN